MREENKQMRILSAIGMILVVAGHLGYSLFDVGGLFLIIHSMYLFFCLFPVIFTGRKRSSISCAILVKSAKRCCFLISSGIWSMEFWQCFCTAQAFPLEEN